MSGQPAPLSQSASTQAKGGLKRAVKHGVKRAVKHGVKRAVKHGSCKAWEL